MSNEALRWVAQVQRDRVLTGNAKGSALAVLLELADCHNASSGQCNPKMATLVTATGFSRATVYRALALLRHKVGLTTSPLPNSTQYDLPIPGWTAAEPPPPAFVPRKKRTGGRELTRFIMEPPMVRDEEWHKTAESELAKMRKIMGRRR